MELHRDKFYVEYISLHGLVFEKKSHPDQLIPHDAWLRINHYLDLEDKPEEEITGEQINFYRIKASNAERHLNEYVDICLNDKEKQKMDYEKKIEELQRLLDEERMKKRSIQIEAHDLQAKNEGNIGDLQFKIQKLNSSIQEERNMTAMKEMEWQKEREDLIRENAIANKKLGIQIVNDVKETFEGACEDYRDMLDDSRKKFLDMIEKMTKRIEVLEVTIKKLKEMYENKLRIYEDSEANLVILQKQLSNLAKASEEKDKLIEELKNTINQLQAQMKGRNKKTNDKGNDKKKDEKTANKVTPNSSNSGMATNATNGKNLPPKISSSTRKNHDEKYKLLEEKMRQLEKDLNDNEDYFRKKLLEERKRIQADYEEQIEGLKIALKTAENSSKISQAERERLKSLTSAKKTEESNKDKMQILELTKRLNKAMEEIGMYETRLEMFGDIEKKYNTLLKRENQYRDEITYYNFEQLLLRENERVNGINRMIDYFMEICSYQMKNCDIETMPIYESYYIPLHNLLLQLEELHYQAASSNGSTRRHYINKIKIINKAIEELYKEFNEKLENEKENTEESIYFNTLNQLRLLYNDREEIYRESEENELMFIEELKEKDNQNIMNYPNTKKAKLSLSHYPPCYISESNQVLRAILESYSGNLENRIEHNKQQYEKFLMFKEDLNSGKYIFDRRMDIRTCERVSSPDSILEKSPIKYLSNSSRYDNNKYKYLDLSKDAYIKYAEKEKYCTEIEAIDLSKLKIQGASMKIEEIDVEEEYEKQNEHLRNQLEFANEKYHELEESIRNQPNKVVPDNVIAPNVIKKQSDYWYTMYECEKIRNKTLEESIKAIRNSPYKPPKRNSIRRSNFNRPESRFGNYNDDNNSDSNSEFNEEDDKKYLSTIEELSGNKKRKSKYDNVTSGIKGSDLEKEVKNRRSKKEKEPITTISRGTNTEPIEFVEPQPHVEGRPQSEMNGNKDMIHPIENRPKSCATNTHTNRLMNSDKAGTCNYIGYLDPSYRCYKKDNNGIIYGEYNESEMRKNGMVSPISPPKDGVFVTDKNGGENEEYTTKDLLRDFDQQTEVVVIRSRSNSPPKSPEPGDGIEYHTVNYFSYSRSNSPPKENLPTNFKTSQEFLDEQQPLTNEKGKVYLSYLPAALPQPVNHSNSSSRSTSPNINGVSLKGKSECTVINFPVPPIHNLTKDDTTGEDIYVSRVYPSGLISREVIINSPTPPPNLKNRVSFTNLSLNHDYKKNRKLKKTNEAKDSSYRSNGPIQLNPKDSKSYPESQITINDNKIERERYSKSREVQADPDVLSSDLEEELIAMYELYRSEVPTSAPPIRRPSRITSGKTRSGNSNTQKTRNYRDIKSATIGRRIKDSDKDDEDEDEQDFNDGIEVYTLPFEKPYPPTKPTVRSKSKIYSSPSSKPPTSTTYNINFGIINENRGEKLFTPPPKTFSSPPIPPRRDESTETSEKKKKEKSEDECFRGFNPK